MHGAARARAGRAARAAPARGARLRAYLREAALATAIGGVSSMVALMQVYASRFANAYLAQMLFAFTPLCTGAANRALLKQPTPPKLWPAAALALGGAAMAVAGQWLGDRAAGKAAAGREMTTKDMIIGLALALGSTLLMSAYLVILQVGRCLPWPLLLAAGCNYLYM